MWNNLFSGPSKWIDQYTSVKWPVFCNWASIRWWISWICKKHVQRATQTQLAAMCPAGNHGNLLAMTDRLIVEMNRGFMFFWEFRFEPPIFVKHISSPMIVWENGWQRLVANWRGEQLALPQTNICGVCTSCHIHILIVHWLSLFLLVPMRRCFVGASSLP